LNGFSDGRDRDRTDGLLVADEAKSTLRRGWQSVGSLRGISNGLPVPPSLSHEKLPTLHPTASPHLPETGEHHATCPPANAEMKAYLAGATRLIVRGGVALRRDVRVWLPSLESWAAALPDFSVEFPWLISLPPDCCGQRQSIKKYRQSHHKLFHRSDRSALGATEHPVSRTWHTNRTGN